MSPRNWSVEEEVRRRYSRGAREAEPDLCCPRPREGEARFLEAIPEEVLEKDYGCGDPSAWVREGETVLDLGSGAGKACFVLSQKVGPTGRVLGVDFNDAMLEVARAHRDEVARAVGHDNVRFLKGRIQDLALDLDRAQSWLERNPVRRIEDMDAYARECDRLREEEPMVPSGSVDVVVSNCVLNLVRAEHKPALFTEIHRVLRRGGRAVISDIVCDEDPTPTILEDPELWSGCISGAFREDLFLEMFEGAGLYGVEIVARAEQPWRVVDGIEFRSMTVRAFKGKEGPCLERLQAVVYLGPWKEVRDDDGHVYERGKRAAVCDKTFRILTDPSGPYAGLVAAVEPRLEVHPDRAGAFPCDGSRVRSPRETKGKDYRETSSPPREDGACGPGCC